VNRKILWNVFHPDLRGKSRGNQIVTEVIRRECEVTFVDHYREYPSFQIDVETEQEKLVDHEMIVFQFPIYWYSTPALMKEWQDKVLQYGFAYPPSEGTALHGKKMLCVVTTSGSEMSYRSGGFNNFTLYELMRPLQQTAALCGMDWISPKIIYNIISGDEGGIRSKSNEEIEELANEIASYLKSFEHEFEIELDELTLED
jgi:putative NADPH-quinone reductase